MAGRPCVLQPRRHPEANSPQPPLPAHLTPLRVATTSAALLLVADVAAKAA